MLHESEIFKKGEQIYCIDESIYGEHLRKRQVYEVVEVGTDTKLGKVRIKGNRNRLVWISDSYFSKNNQPEIESINIDDEIQDSFNDNVDVTVSFKSGKRWFLQAITIEYLKNSLLNGELFFGNEHTIILIELTSQTIEEVIYSLDRSNRLFDILVPYDN